MNAAAGSATASALEEIGEVIRSFVRRDQGDWEGVRALFAPQAELHLSWFAGPIERFLEASRAAAERGAPPPRHILGEPAIDVIGDRAVADTPVQVVVRGGGATPFEVTSYLRFADRLERSGGRWVVRRRVAVYEHDRLKALDAHAPVDVPHDASTPLAYRNLAFALDGVGLHIADGAVVAGSDADLDLRADDRRWLNDGEPTPRSTSRPLDDLDDLEQE